MPHPRAGEVNPGGGALATYLLKLYVTGTSPRAQVAIANLRRICEEELHGEYQLEIIDVLEHPQLAEDEKILATPTLIKQLPPPLRRVIGDLSDKEKVLLGLEVRRDAPRPERRPDA
jgi:circadian clock protein KaiB